MALGLNYDPRKPAKLSNVGIDHAGRIHEDQVTLAPARQGHKSPNSADFIGHLVAIPIVFIFVLSGNRITQSVGAEGPLLAIQIT